VIHRLTRKRRSVLPCIISTLVPYSIPGPCCTRVQYHIRCILYQTDKRSGAIVHKITHASESNKHKEIKSYARDYRGLRQLSSVIYSHTKLGPTHSLNPPKSSQPTTYHPNNRANTSLEIHTPTNNPTTAITIRIVFDVFGATARVMRSAEDTRPDATELNVLVFF
jgi:hypothetical protein